MNNITEYPVSKSKKRPVPKRGATRRITRRHRSAVRLACCLFPDGTNFDLFPKSGIYRLLAAHKYYWNPREKMWGKVGGIVGTKEPIDLEISFATSQNEALFAVSQSILGVLDAHGFYLSTFNFK